MKLISLNAVEMNTVLVNGMPKCAFLFIVYITISPIKNGKKKINLNYPVTTKKSNVSTTNIKSTVKCNMTKVIKLSGYCHFSLFTLFQV